MHFENPTRPPFLRGGQCQWHGRSYSPSELRYTPLPISQPCRSKSHSPASQMPSAHTYHGYLDDPPSEPFSVALFLSLLNAREDAIPPLDAWIRGPLVQQCKVVLFPHPTARLSQFAASPQRPHHPRFTTSPVTGWRNVPSLSSLCDEIGTVGDL